MRREGRRRMGREGRRRGGEGEKRRGGEGRREGEGRRGGEKRRGKERDWTFLAGSTHVLPLLDPAGKVVPLHCEHVAVQRDTIRASKLSLSIGLLCSQAIAPSNKVWGALGL